MPLQLVVPKTFPSTGPLRIIVQVPSFLLQQFSACVDSTVEALGPHEFLKEESSDCVTDELARRAITTCFGSDAKLPAQIIKAYVGRINSDEWSFKIHFDCDIPIEQTNPPVAAFYCQNELDEDGNAEFIALVPKTEKAKWKHNNALVIPSHQEVAEFVVSTRPTEAQRLHSHRAGTTHKGSDR